MLQNIPTLWPLRQTPAKELKEQQLCGPGLPRGFWVCPLFLAFLKNESSNSIYIHVANFFSDIAMIRISHERLVCAGDL